MSASALADVCRFNPTAGGTPDWTFSSAVTGYQSPATAGLVNGAQYSYRAESADLSQWEVGQGIYNSGTGVLTRATVLWSSAGAGTKVSFSAAPQVAIVALAEDLQQNHPSGAKAWGFITFSGSTATIAAGFNCASISRSAAGNYTVTLSNALSSANFAVVISAKNGVSNTSVSTSGTPVTSTTFNIIHFENGAGTDPANISFAVYAT